MSSKSSKRSTSTKTAMVTKSKSAQNSRDMRAKNKKNTQPINTKSPNEQKKSTKYSATCKKDTPLKDKVRHLIQLVEQVEYYPDKLKRVARNKKVFLKPKHNFSVVASTHRRKWNVPRKGECPLSNQYNRYDDTPQISMIDMVALMEDNEGLTDEDLLEILTCPSPVWWEDPPDDGYLEDAICTRSSSTCLQQEPNDDNRVQEQGANKSFDIKNNTFKTTANHSFNKKKRKLENLLFNIKNDTKNNTLKTEKIIKDGDIKNKSGNTDDEDLSDISFNEEELINNLENMDIPIEQTDIQNVAQTKNKNTNIAKSIQSCINEQKGLVTQTKNEITVPDVLPPLKRKPDIKQNNDINSDFSDCNVDYNLDHSNFRFISDEDIISETNSSTRIGKQLQIVDISSSLGESSSTIDLDAVTDYAIKKDEIETKMADSCDKDNDVLPKKTINDLTEYITVYKIMSCDENNDEMEQIKPESSNNNKIDNTKGHINNFFKKCKGNKRLKKSDITFPAIPVKSSNSKEERYSDGDEENRLKPCDVCVQKIENGTKEFSCEKCERHFTCDLCSFFAENKELYTKHISKCSLGRISWKNNCIVSQT